MTLLFLKHGPRIIEGLVVNKSIKLYEKGFATNCSIEPEENIGLAYYGLLSLLFVPFFILFALISAFAPRQEGVHSGIVAVGIAIGMMIFFPWFTELWDLSLGFGVLLFTILWRNGLAGSKWTLNRFFLFRF